MASKLRLNVVCTSRDKRFLVLADEDWLLEDVRTCTELVFHKLYPAEETLKVSKLQNEFHFDLPLDYIAGDTLTDLGLLFAVEDDSHLTLISQRNISHIVSQVSVQTPPKDKKNLKRKKKGKNPKTFSKRKTASGNDTGCTSSDAVTSTTGSRTEDYNLMPQVVERMPCEDTDVDIETLED